MSLACRSIDRSASPRSSRLARVAASGANYVIDDARASASLEDSIADINWLAATTARQRDLRKPVLTPEQAISEMRARIARGERCAILFGRERNGLETGEVANADALIMIPVNSRFASLNLAQAVLLLGYGWVRGDKGRSLGPVTTYEKPLSEGLDMGRRGLHNEGSEVLRERLAGKIDVDFDTSRRLFTLICALLARA